MNIDKILVTGADGFMGSHLTESLIRQGYSVRAFVLYNSFNSWGWLDHCGDDVKGKFEVFTGYIRDPNGVRTAMKDCDAVLHLAALIAIPFSYHSPDTYVDTNIKGTLNVLQLHVSLVLVESFIHRRAKFMVQHVLFLLPKNILCKANPLIRQRKLQQINSLIHFTHLLICR